MFPIAYLITHGAVVHESGYNISLLRATMVEQTVQNLVRSISCATSLSLVASQAFFAFVYNIGASLKPLRDWRGDIDGEAIFFFVGFLWLLVLVLVVVLGGDGGNMACVLFGSGQISKDQERNPAVRKR